MIRTLLVLLVLPAVAAAGEREQMLAKAAFEFAAIKPKASPKLCDCGPDCKCGCAETGVCTCQKRSQNIVSLNGKDHYKFGSSYYPTSDWTEEAARQHWQQPSSTQPMQSQPSSMQSQPNSMQSQPSFAQPSYQQYAQPSFQRASFGGGGGGC